ncbi:hypothetical protein Ate01nite_72560 [Actinoplanes teichomyceticus]|nr:hypothetical protein Ate01nite_72560 [Actinoplanes teichomyceticus]
MTRRREDRDGEKDQQIRPGRHHIQARKREQRRVGQGAGGLSEEARRLAGGLRATRRVTTGSRSLTGTPEVPGVDTARRIRATGAAGRIARPVRRGGPRTG